MAEKARLCRLYVLFNKGPDMACRNIWRPSYCRLLISAVLPVAQPAI